uniref:FAST kinase domains 5 n=1 Tax=Callorhinchus milii TaxID=7868 RepID=A0A4W3IKW9_CALMI|eukprot:gi/632960453/ref/XP_007896204.1/ PREDICTED: FAST kinase domain-containing protein 5 [Callorhinchus milii]
MAAVVCRKLPTRVYSRGMFCKSTWCTKETKAVGRGQERNDAASEKSGTTILCMPGASAALSDYEVYLNPAAYSSSQRRTRQRELAELGDHSADAFLLWLGNPCGNLGGKKAHSTYMVSCSRWLSSGRNTLLELIFSGSAGRPRQSFRQLAASRQDAVTQEVDSAEVYDTKEDPRAFQKVNNAYKALCFDSLEQGETLSAGEVERILRDVSILKSSLSPDRISGYFQQLGQSALLGEEQSVAIRRDPRFTMLCRYATEHLRGFSSLQLIGVLIALTRLALPPAHPFLHPCEAEFCRRVWDMGFEELLLVADLWRYLGRSVPRFLEMVASYAGVRWKALSLPQLVQFIYIIGENRRAPAELMQKLEMLVSLYLDQMNLEEVGAVCLGFFKSSHGLSENLMKRIGDMVLAHVEDISNYALVNVMKMFRYTHVDHLPFLKRLGEAVSDRVPGMGTQGVMHVVLSCASLHYRDELLLSAVAASIPSKAPHCRSKDVAKFLWSFSSLNYEPPNVEEFYRCLTEQVHRKMQEFERFPEHLLTALLALAFTGRYPHDLLDVALSPQFVHLALSSSAFELKRDLFTLEGSVAIECPHYTGHRLPLPLQEEISEALRAFARQEICTKPEMTEAESSLRVLLGGPEYVKNHTILPHARSAELEVHFDLSGKPLPFNTEAPGKNKPKRKLNFSGIQVTDLLISQLTKRNCPGAQGPAETSAVAPEGDVVGPEAGFQDHNRRASYEAAFRDGISLTNGLLESLNFSKVPAKEALHQPDQLPETPRKLAIQVSNRNHYCHSSRILLGLHSMKRRQLVQAGYVVVELPHWEWFPLLKRTRSEKLAYLHQKLYSALD